VGGLLLLAAGDSLFQSVQEGAALARGEAQVAVIDYDTYGNPVSERKLDITPEAVAAVRTRAIVLGVLGVLAFIAGAVTQGPPWRGLAPAPQKPRDP
jgi:hypothetical protein